MNITLTLDLSPAFAKAIADIITAFGRPPSADMVRKLLFERPKPPPAMPDVSIEVARGVAEVAAHPDQPAPAFPDTSTNDQPTAASPGIRWTEARKALVRAEYTSSTDLRALHRKLNVLPGDPIPHEIMRWWANREGLAKRRKEKPAAKVPAAPAGATVVSADADAIVRVDTVTDVEVPTTPPAPPPPPAPVDAPRWTDERRAVLDFYYPAGDALPDILERLNAFPGLTVTETHLKAEIIARKLVRADRTKAAPPASRASGGSVETDDATIRHWAAGRGLCNGGEPLDLDRINRKRVDLGLPPFVRVNRMAASAGTMRPAQIGGAV